MADLNVSHQSFAEHNGQLITEYTMVNNHGMEVSCLNYGCIITKMLVPDRAGKMENVVLGYDTFADYLAHSPYFGAVVGRHAGRIQHGEFTLGGKVYTLAKNNNQNHLHGGNIGFDKVVWQTEVIVNENEAGLKFRYFSKDGEEGYPGNLDMIVTYCLNNNNELIITHEGVCDQQTVLNVTNHTYFNLSGNLKRDILDHVLTLSCDRLVELDHECIPTGNVLPVDETFFDFRNGRRIGEGVESGAQQIEIVGKGYDHPFLFLKQGPKVMSLYDQKSGRQISIETNQEAVVLYTGNHLAQDHLVRGVISRPYLGLCLETQAPPDSVHHPHFPSAILEKNETYQSTTSYKFNTLPL